MEFAWTATMTGQPSSPSLPFIMAERAGEEVVPFIFHVSQHSSSGLRSPETFGNSRNFRPRGKARLAQPQNHPAHLLIGSGCSGFAFVEILAQQQELEPDSLIAFSTASRVSPVRF